MSIANSPNRRAMQLTGRDYISHSALATYQQCPLKYRFRYIDELPEESVSANLLFGAAIHKALEYFFAELMAGNAAPKEAALLEAYHEYWQSQSHKRVRYRRGEDRAHHAGVALRMFRKLRNSSHAQPAGEILGVEVELRGSILAGCPDLRARLDLLVETDSAVIVTDIKTSRGPWNAGHADKIGDQLLLYGALVEEAFPAKPVQLQFVVITKTKSPSIEVHKVHATQERIQRTKDTAMRTWELIDAERFEPVPSDLNCASCPFQKPCRGERAARRQ